MTWTVGLRMVFANFGGLDPCSPEGGLADLAVMRGARWRTSRGLRIGDPVSRLHRLYPTATARGGLWWLVTGYTPIGEGGYYPVLAAAVGRGRVRALRAGIGAAGD